MTNNAIDPQSIPAGTPVASINGTKLGTVREAYPHYLMVDQPGIHDDLEVPSHAIVEFTAGVLVVTVNRNSANAVEPDDDFV